MKIKITKTLFLVAACMLGNAASAADAIQVPKVVPYVEDNDISDAIKTECRMGEVLANSIKQHSGDAVALVDGKPGTEHGRVLDIVIVDAVSGGNAFIGHQKSTKIRGSLYDDGKKVASFKARRNSMGGAFAGFKGSCSVLGRTVEALGEDVSAWLKAPKDGAALGD